MKAYRAKQIAKEKVVGDYTGQYSLLRDYALELQRTNPGTTVKIEVERNIDQEDNCNTRQFKRIYVCLGVLKNGFKAGNRDLLGLDGCFMSGPWPGQILTAVVVDCNNETYLVAYVVVEAKTKDAWMWFLDYLGDDLDLTSESNFTFISDRQKGILPAISTLFPNAEHRFCLKHIYDNMKLVWRGQLYKECLWKCATSTTIQYFDKNMDELKDTCKDAYEWLKKIPAVHWSRSHFSGRAHCDVLLNNMCEVLNRQLLEGRDKLIITCLEYIGEYLMKKIVNVQKVIAKCDGPLTPNAIKLLNVIKEQAAQYKVEVDMGFWTNIMSHPVFGEFSFKINPVNGKQFWPKSSVPIERIPPKYHPQVGRPPKKRKKSAMEVEEMVNYGKLTSLKDLGSLPVAAKGDWKRQAYCKREGQANDGLMYHHVLDLA
ncbi:mutator type transposase [Tanacetum coccineum]